MVSSKDLPPIGSPFFPNIFFKNQFRSKPKWAPKSTDLTGEVAVVTGANSGLGLEASNQLLSLKLSHLIIAVRSVAKGNKAADTLRVKYPKAVIDVYQLDMSSYDSIKKFVTQLEQLQHLNIAILNAGVMPPKRRVVPETGHEEIVQVNYISTALLCILLLPVLKRNPAKGPGRITIVGSGLAFQAKLSNQKASPLLPSLDDTKSFNAENQYNISKLLGMMFLSKLAGHVSADDVAVNIVDPGFVKDTSLSRDNPFVVSVFLAIFKSITARTVEVGASTYVDAAVVKGKESHGCYIMSWEISP